MAYFGSYFLLIWGVGVVRIIFTKCPGSAPRSASGPRAKSVPRVSPECPGHLLTLRGHSRDTFWTHSRDTSGPKCPRDSCSRWGGGLQATSTPSPQHQCYYRQAPPILEDIPMITNAESDLQGITKTYSCGFQWFSREEQDS